MIPIVYQNISMRVVSNKYSTINSVCKTHRMIPPFDADTTFIRIW